MGRKIKKEKRIIIFINGLTNVYKCDIMIQLTES